MTKHVRKIQFVLWTGILGLTCGILGTWLAGSEEWLRFFDNLHLTFSTIAAALLCWIAIQIKPEAHDSRRWWFAVGISAYAIGQIIRDLQPLAESGSFPSGSDLFYLWLGPCLALGLIDFVSERVSARQLSFFSVDCAMAVVVAVALVMVFFLPKKGNLALPEMVGLILYPASLLAVLCIAVVVLLTLRLRLTWAWSTFLLAVSSMAWSWMKRNSIALDGVVTVGAWFNGFFSVGVLLLAVSIVYLELQPCNDRNRIRHYEGILRLLPLIAVVLVSVAVIATIVIPSLLENIVRVIWTSAVAVVVLAVVRQHALLRDYDRWILAETALKQERLLLNAMVESLPGVFVLLNEHGRILKHNSYIANFIDSDSGDSRPMHVRSLIPLQNRKQFDDQLRQVLVTGEASFEKPLWSVNQQWVMHSFSFKRIVFNDATYLMGIGIDISNVNDALLALEESRNLLQQVVDTLPMRVFWKDKQSRYLGCNTLFAKDVGFSDTGLVQGKADYDLAWSKQESDGFVRDDKEVMLTLKPKLAFDQKATCADGKQIWMRTSKVPLLDINNHLLGVVGVYGDVTEHKHLEEMHQLAGLVFEHSRESIVVSDENNRVVAVNPAFTRLTGYQSEEIIGKDPSFLRADGQDEEFFATIWQSIRERGFWDGETWARRKNGDVYPQRLSISVVRRPDGAIFRHVAIGADVSDKKQAEQMIWHQANFDVLTNLPNRRMLAEHLERERKLAQRGEYKFALLFLDLDHFKDVNDTLGHEMGDALLVEASKRMRQCVRETDTLARLGGDEFALVIPRAEQDDIERICNAILENIKLPFQLEKEQAFVSASIGIAFYPDDGSTVEELLRKADQAMYAAKHSGRSCFHYFKAEMQEAAMLHMRLAADMRGSLEVGEFNVYFQPIVDLGSGRISKAEVLLRWKHPLFGFIGPDQFIAIAESNGFIHELGNWVFTEALKWSQRWSGLIGDTFVNSVNLSPVQLMRGQYFGDWLKQFAESGLGRDGLVLEITEGVLLNDNPEVNEKLINLQRAGMQVSIDDFGTGYSSLAYLNKFPIHFLKIDKSFVGELTSSETHRSLVEGIVLMAHKLNLKVIAEGVETEAQRDLLISAGCDCAQGYLFSRPIVAEEFEAQFIGDGRSWT
ncbi:EAL domain-containing protein [Methylomonas sp. MgM2]